MSKSKSNKLRLTSISLETKSGRKIKLDMDEAKELHDQLRDLFGEKSTAFGFRLIGKPSSGAATQPRLSPRTTLGT